jgi:hypothetical protein
MPDKEKKPNPEIKIPDQSGKKMGQKNSLPIFQNPPPPPPPPPKKEK